VIRSERRGPVTVVTLDRPERRNAVDAEACEQLRAEVDLAVAGETRAMVIAGAGDHFCAGADLGGVHDDRFRRSLRAALDALAQAPLVTIAAVHGAALGAGTQLAVACDLRVATPDARFGIPAAKLGLMVDHWTVQRLALLAGHGPARAMLVAAEEIDGATALRLGFVQRAGSVDDAVAWAESISGLAPLTVTGHKLALERTIPPAGPDPDVDAAIARAWSSDDLAEGMAAFRERRTPSFRGR
jgi:enoyl-CoA hydratase